MGRDRSARRLAAIVLVAVTAAGACGRDQSTSTGGATSNTAASAAPVTPATARPGTPADVADRFMGAWRSNALPTAGGFASAKALDEAGHARVDITKVVARGCARPDQVPGTHDPSASMVCVYALPWQGEIRVDVGEAAGVWRVVGVGVA